MRQVEEMKKVELTKSVITEIYSHVTMLTKSKYKLPLENIKRKNKIYDTEDFIQEVVLEILKSFGSKTFTSIKKLKSFINCSTEFHYLHVKRKHFDTKYEGKATVLSFEEPVDESGRVLGDTIKSNKDYDVSILDMENLMGKNLYAVYDWKTFTLMPLRETKKYKSGVVLSVNHFIEKQRELGGLDTCRYYKDKGFYMTKNIFNQFSQAIIDYANETQLLLIEKETKPYQYYRPSSIDSTLDKIKKFGKVCTCGHVNDAFDIYEDTWQCSHCGKIHRRDDLVSFHTSSIKKHLPITFV